MRPLTSRERSVIAAMLERAPAVGPDAHVSDADRNRWADQLPVTWAGEACSCGTCPSINLTDSSGRPSDSWQSRTILEAACDDGWLFLFIHDDRLSYLELAPISDDGRAEFPDPGGVFVGT
ncbi:hypothetical protein [Agromyces sp. GXS1127]|uniref:hypothetical protein n=1 Tax=Agromyces sp. GXS1127 TaxID=3424181 RepID=UPI003D3113A4